jgi:NodT family efflux transporter outer membrane factor (OMF) lipoprotein
MLYYIHRGSFCLALIILFFAAHGCIRVGPDFAPPAVKLAKNWQDAKDQTQKNRIGEYQYWWRNFKDPCLDRIIQIACRENLTLRIVGVHVMEARAGLAAAVGEWFPQTQQAFGSVAWTRRSARSPGAVQGTGQVAAQSQGSSVFNQSVAGSNTDLSYAQADIGMRASWEIDMWGKFSRAIEAADATLAATVADYDDTLVSLISDAAGYYIIIRTLEKRLDIARQNVATQTESLSIAQERFIGGTTSERDVAQAKTLLDDTRALIPALEILQRQAKNALSVLLGMPPSELTGWFDSGKPEIPEPPAQPVMGIPAELLRRRPDIRSAEARAAAQCAAIGAVKADLFPSFMLSGTFGFEASDLGKSTLGKTFQWKSRTGSGGPGFQWNVFNYGQITNQVRVQDARFQELLLAYQQAVLKAQQEVEDALIAFLRTQTRAAYLAESTASARRSLELAILQYRGGITDFTTVLTAQQSLLNEQDKLANTLGDISLNLIAVYRALGGGWQVNEAQDFVPETIKQEMAQRTSWGSLLKPAATPSAGPSKSVIRLPEW